MILVLKPKYQFCSFGFGPPGFGFCPLGFGVGSVRLSFGIGVGFGFHPLGFGVVLVSVVLVLTIFKTIVLKTSC